MFQIPLVNKIFLSACKVGKKQVTVVSKLHLTNHSFMLHFKTISPTLTALRAILRSVNFGNLMYSCTHVGVIFIVQEALLLNKFCLKS